MLCYVSGCDREAIYVTLRLCKKHYDRRRFLGDENAQVRATTLGMSIPEKLAHFRVIPDDLNQCFGWSGYTGTKGYAQLLIMGKNHQAHRLAYEEEVDEIPDDYVVDHICHNWDLTCPGGKNCLHRRCTNPRHLQLATNKQNIDAAQKSKRPKRPGYSHPNARKTHCPKGHEYTDENTVWTKASSLSGVARRCRTCLKEKWTRSNAKRDGRSVG